MIKIAIDKGVAPRVEIASFEQAKAYLEMGVRHLCIGTDLVTLYQWCRRQAEEVKKILT